MSGRKLSKDVQRMAMAQLERRVETRQLSVRTPSEDLLIDEKEFYITNVISSGEDSSTEESWDVESAHSTSIFTSEHGDFAEEESVGAIGRDEMQEVFAEEDEEMCDEVEECESVVQGTDVEEAMERQGLVRLVQKEKDPTPPPFILIDGRVHRRLDAAEPSEEEDVESSGSEWFPPSEDLPSSEDSRSEWSPASEDLPSSEDSRSEWFPASEDLPSSEDSATEDEPDTRSTPVAVEATTSAKSQTRTPAPKRRQKTTGSKAQRACPVEGCRGRVVNMARHFRQVHPCLDQQDFTQRKQQARTYGGKKRCAECETVTMRMDLHIRKVHKIEKASQQYLLMMERATPVGGESQSSDLDKALDMYSDKLQDRSSGVVRMEFTATSHRTAVKTFLPELSKEALLELPKLGVKGGKIDQIFESGKLKATSMKTYLHALAAFIGFLAGEGSMLRSLGMTTHDLDTIRQKVITIAQTLRQDISRQAVEEAGQNPDGAIQLQPWMAGKYLEGVERDLARQLIQREIAGEPLSPREWCAVRNSLILQLLLTNFKRSGDLSHLQRSVVLEAQVDPSGPNEDGVEVFIIQHKEARSGKRCPLSIDSEVFSDIQLFARHLAKINEGKNPKGYLFTTKEGNTISPTNMSKIIEATWVAFGRRIDEDLPKLTGSGNRKLAVTTHREVGADRQEQVALASHMAHRVDTADRYYNKGQLRAARSSAVKRVTSAYKEAARARDQQGEEDVE